MSPLLPEAEALRLTCQIVAACCHSLPTEGSHLPGLIASVAKSLRELNGPLAQEPSAATQRPRSGSEARSAKTKKPSAASSPQRALETAPLKAASPPRADSTNVEYLNAFSRASARSV
jgi:hypothetical protein